MHDATFARPDLTTFARLNELGLESPASSWNLAARCSRAAFSSLISGVGGAAVNALRDTVTRRLALEPLGWRPTTLVVTIRRYRCTGCRHVWRQDTGFETAESLSSFLCKRLVLFCSIYRCWLMRSG